MPPSASLTSLHRLLLAAAIASASFVPARSPAQPVAKDAAPLRLSDRPVVAGALGERLDAYVSRLVPFGYAGNVLVLRGGTPVLAKGYGLANRERGTAFTPRTIVPIGSIVKVFTNAAVLALEAEGKLRTTDSLARFLPDLPPDKRAITLHQLMTHSSGLPMGFGDDDAPMSRAEFLQRVRESPLAYAPGTGRSYSNVAYGVLAAIVEDLAGRDLEGYVRERLLLPAGMHETGWHYPRWDSLRVAHAYMRGRDTGTELALPRSEGARPTWNVHGAGGWVSTLEDFARWHAALAGDRLLPAAQRAKLHEPQLPARPGAPPDGPRAGYQWSFDRSPLGGRAMSTGGGNLIYETALVRHLDHDLLVVVTNNTGGQVSVRTAADLGRLAAGLDPEVRPPAVTATARAALAPLEGVYRLASGATVTVSARDDGLALAPDGQDAFDAVFVAPAAARPRREQLAARTDSIVRATLAGDWGPFRSALDLDAPADAVAARETAQRRGLAAELGAARGHRVAGVVPSAGGGHVIVRFEHERGGFHERYGWLGDRVGLFRREREAPTATVFPTGEASFAGFDLQRGGGVEVRVVPPADGRPARLLLRTPAGEVEAVREG